MSNTANPKGEEGRSKSDITVKSIDVYGIHDRLRKDKTKEGKEVWNYIKKLNEALKRQQELTAHAISKIRSLSTPPTESEPDKNDAINFFNYVHEQGYELSERRYMVYLGGKYYWIWDIYKLYKTHLQETKNKEQ